MELEKLYRLVHSMSKEQKTNFTVGLGKKGDTYYKLLYERIVKTKRLDDLAKARIRGKEFKSPSKYYTYRAKLADLILNSLVSQDISSQTQMPLVEVAYLYNAEEIGYKVLVSELEKAHEKEDFLLLRYIYDFISDLRDRYGFKIDLPASLFDEESLNLEMIIGNEYKHVLDEIRNSFNLDEGEKRRVARRLKETLRHSPASETNKNRLLKARIGISMLRGEYQATFHLGEELVRRMKSGIPKYSIFEIARELQFMASNAIFCGSRDVSMKYALELSILEPSSPHEQDAIQQAKVMTWIYFSLAFLEKKIAIEAMKEIMEATSVFRPTLLKKLIFILSLAFLKAEDYSNAIKCTLKFWEIRDGSEDLLTWEPYLVFAMSHIAKGNDDIAEAQLRSASREAAKQPYQYPHFAISTILKLWNNPRSKHQMISEIALSELDSLFSNGDEQRAAAYFDIKDWLKAQAYKTSLREVVKSQNQSKSERFLGVVGF